MDLQAALADRYLLERPLGQGGMAMVYLAHDLRHDRRVALKVMRPELAAALGPERFLREIHVAARLQHPHIVPMLDSGDAGGQLWYTMPHVRGESLRALLERDGRLSIETALELTRQIALALDYAHREGVVHRDLKPENILLSEGQALIADFGLAKALESGGDRLTGSGIAVGTAAYISPEQATTGEVDGRTDVYSLGCVLYEMLAGEPPFTGSTPQSIIAKRFHTPPPSVRLLRPEIPPVLDRTIAHALALEPADRIASGAELAQSLAATAVPAPARRRPWTTAVLLVLLGAVAVAAGVLWRTSPGREEVATPATKRLAVLPFENLGSPADEYFADGVSDAVRGKLASLPGLVVIARASSIPYRRTTAPPRQIGRELGVRYLLTGTVRWTRLPGGGSRVQVSPELVEVSEKGAPTTRWQQPFDATLSDVFEVQGTLARDVAQALNLALGVAERGALADQPTRNLEAYDAFLQAEAASEGMGLASAAGYRAAIDGYERAVRADPKFMPAWAQLSRTLSYTYYNGVRTDAIKARALEAAEQTMTLAPERPEGWVARGDYASKVSDDPARALAFYERARGLAPPSAELLTAMAFAERIMGRWDSTVAHLRAARALDPRSVRTATTYIESLLLTHRFDEALAVLDGALAAAPRNLTLIQDKALLYAQQGDLARARSWIRSVERTVPPDTLAPYFAIFGDLYWLLEERDLRRLPLLDAGSFGSRKARAEVLAQVYHLLGDRTRSRAWADSALAETPADCGTDAQCHGIKAVQLALAGRAAEAVREGRMGVEASPIAKDAYIGPYAQHQLVRAYLLTGQPDKALDALEPLLEHPYMLTPGSLRVDPGFASLRGHPRFERMLAGARPKP